MLIRYIDDLLYLRILQQIILSNMPELTEPLMEQGHSPILAQKGTHIRYQLSLEPLG